MPKALDEARLAGINNPSRLNPKTKLHCYWIVAARNFNSKDIGDTWLLVPDIKLAGIYVRRHHTCKSIDSALLQDRYNISGMWAYYVDNISCFITKLNNWDWLVGDKQWQLNATWI